MEQNNTPLLKRAAQQQAAFSAGIKEMNGYETITTFYADMTIAEAYGLQGVRETYSRINRDWRSNAEYYTEFILVLNHKIYQHHGRNEALADLYSELWEEADTWALDNFKDEELAHYFALTD